ncbi:MAG TPA: CheR family methyltransferase [Nitrospiria bacterium]|nr:CheR family methyltransferase [Nitrospiria bacterium]
MRYSGAVATKKQLLGRVAAEIVGNGRLMTDRDCVEFLQWALPTLRFRWPGFRKVRRIVCKRLDQRFRELDVSGPVAYRTYLEHHPEEWTELERFCAIPISRFYRDRGVFETITRDVFPTLARSAVARGESTLRCWSIGCAAGEEPYTLAIIWRLGITERFPCRLRIVATDVDGDLLARAGRGCYSPSSVKDVPAAWRTEAFTRSNGLYCVREEFRHAVVFLRQDLRTAAPDGHFQLIVCRNLAFTYFEDRLQRDVLGTIRTHLAPDGVLVIGATESLPESVGGFLPWPGAQGIYRRTDD